MLDMRRSPDPTVRGVSCGPPWLGRGRAGLGGRVATVDSVANVTPVVTARADTTACRTLSSNMSVRIGRETVARLLDAGPTFALQVRHPSDPGAALSALKLARVDVLGLAARNGSVDPDERPTVSGVVNAPDGPLLLVEHVPLDEATLQTVPDVVIRRLEKAGVESATIESPRRGGVLDGLDATPHVVVLRLFPTPRSRSAGLPADWLDIACEWVTGDLEQDDLARLRILGVEYEVASHEVSSYVHECGLARAWCDAVNGDLADRVRTASLTFGRLPHLALAAGGPHVDDAGLVARFHLLQEVARELAADTLYACIDFEPSFEGLALGLSPAGWQAQGGASPNDVARSLLADHVPDAYPYQVLGPGHLERLGAADLAWDPLGDGRFELTLDEPRAWLPDAPQRDDAQAVGWEHLGPCLVLAADVDALNKTRAASTPPDPSADVDLAVLGSTPDLDSIVLERSAHQRRGTRLTLLELVSWLNHEPHSDAPACVSPVLATFARWLTAGLPDDALQPLKAIASQLIGTAPTAAEDERARQWMATEWLVRRQAPAWLRAAGLRELAERLTSLGPLSQDLELVRAVDILGTAIGIASRRIDITASIVTDDNGDRRHIPDEQLVWEAWERVTERTGWVAASEAATYGAPADLTYATDGRVIECSRDQRAREELEAARQSIGDSAWTTALHAVADDVWERSWRAADGAARELSGFTVRVEMGRVAKNMWSRRDPGLDDDPDTALEAAEHAARDSLTRAALAGGASTDGEHPWDAARNAARASPGGKEWSIVIDEARRAIGENGWAQAMADARAVVTESLHGAPDMVARVVVAAVAREASSAAARGVALRAAAVARAAGADDAGAEAAADAALAETAEALQAGAIDLFERLVDVVAPRDAVLSPRREPAVP
jgi:hypothetical protein